MCLVCSVIQFLLDDRISVFFAVMLLWMHLASLALLPRPGSDSLTQNFLKQSTMMSVGGTLTIDWRSELLASVSLVFFFASIRLMGISSVPITTLDMVASAMESSTMTGGATSSTSSSGSLGDGVLTVLLLFFEGAVAPRPFLVQGAVFFPFEASMMAKVQNKRLELLEWSVESLMDDEEMRSGSSIGSVLISIFLCWLQWIIDWKPPEADQRSGNHQKPGQCSVLWKGRWGAEAGKSNNNKDTFCWSVINGLLMQPALKFCEVNFVPKFTVLGVDCAGNWCKKLSAGLISVPVHSKLVNPANFNHLTT